MFTFGWRFAIVRLLYIVYIVHRIALNLPFGWNLFLSTFNKKKKKFAIQKSHIASHKVNKMFRAIECCWNRLFITHRTYWAVNACISFHFVWFCFISATIKRMNKKYILSSSAHQFMHGKKESVVFHFFWCGFHAAASIYICLWKPVCKMESKWKSDQIWSRPFL